MGSHNIGKRNEILEKITTKADRGRVVKPIYAKCGAI
jgi:hypothetical protein